ncbi:type II secretion system secretin GspD [Massilia sp. PWRC2]|uniref:type II secretion system secretin GspD n=1 Tax=Massilia sp. PWRC2 TaxID=2804626 RepID=UPI003CFA498A
MKTKLVTPSPSVPALRRLAAGAMLACAACAVFPAAPALAQEGPASGAALNFVNADMESVIKAVGHYTGMTFIIDPRVKGTLTLVSERQLSKSQAFSLLTSQLRLQGFAVVTGDGFAKVVPEAEAKLQSSPTRVGVGARPIGGDQIATQIFRLNYESAANLTAVLRPLISPNNSIMANPGNNSLVITDYADNLNRLSKIIAALDAPVSADLDVVPVRYAVASDVAAMVSRLMEPAPGGDSGRVSVLADPRTNSVVVRAPSAARANLAKSLISKLDQPTAEAGNVHVVYLKNADATKLAQTLRAVVSSDTSLPQTQQGTAGGSVGTGASGGAGGAGGAGQQGGALGQGGGTLNAQSPGQTLGSTSGATGAGFIQADASTNTLIITASEAVYRNLRAVIDQLDVRRAQVYIEALVVEINSDKASEFGVQWLAASGDSTSNYRVGGIQNFNATSGNGLAGLIAGNGKTAPGAGLSIGLFRQINGALGLGAIAHALENDNNGNILSTPNMLTLDNELSTIKVGQNVPIISGQFTTTGGTNTNPFQTIDRRDVGLTLKVRPQISEGGTIKLAIYNESSSVVQSSRLDPAGVTTDIRIIENNVLADDGQIIVLGGLIKDDASATEEKVPGLGSLPIVGNLFKYQSRKRTKTNLMVFLRPVIVRSKEDSATLAMNRYEYMRATGTQAQPKDDTVLVKELGSPILPPLSEGQPPVGSSMAAVPIKKNLPAAARPGASTLARPGDSGTPVQPPTTAPSAPASTDAPVYRPVQK